MPITQALNSKANVKKLTNNDLPFAPQQPVMNSFYGTSAAGQTVINLGFTIQVTGSLANTDSLFLFIDGKKLTLGASNDFTFTSIHADGTSSQVTLNQSLVAGLNIQAYKMGLKPEVQFGMDNRFVSAYDYLDQSFQAFIAQNAFLTATSSSGTPAAGKFYSSIQNRTSIVDLTQDLKPRMGVERIATQQIYQLQNEFGPNGEQVFAAANDLNGQIRFVGNWVNDNSTSGARIDSTQNDFVEIVFYGTGLNALMLQWSSSLDARASVDGGAEGSNIASASYSTVLNGRNYNANQVLNVVSGLTLGIHTVKIRNNSANSFQVYGFELLNESSLVKVNPGISYIKGQKYVSAAQQSFAYNSAVTGTRGGRVLVYQSSDGTIGQAFQAVNSVAAYLSSADHTNEEIARTYSFREFGAGRGDDFSASVSGSNNLAFTLDDGTTTLVGSSVDTLSGISYGGVLLNANGSFLTITFIGTGLDFVRRDGANGGSDSYTVSVDGGTAQALASVGNTNQVLTKVCSGLPYGTHTVKIARVSAATYALGAIKFVVYQPKKPLSTLPAGSVELADYNVMANYVANATAGLETIAQGILRKTALRENIYIGSGWSATGVNPAAYVAGQGVGGAANGNSAQYTFFGTGFELRFYGFTSATTSALVTVDGSIPSGVTTSVYGGAAYTAGTGSLNMAAGSTLGCGFALSGLPLGLHTVKLTNNSASAMQFETFDIITPIHSTKSNLYGDIQNTLPVGSCAISDNRKFTPSKDSLPVQKAWAQAVGVTSAPSTTAVYTSPVPMPDMSLTIKTSGGKVLVSYSISAYSSSAQATIFYIYVNGVQVGPWQEFNYNAASFPGPSTQVQVLTLPAGTHKIDVYWGGTGGATSSGQGINRIMNAIEL